MDEQKPKVKRLLSVTEAQMLMATLPRKERYKIYAVGGVVVVFIICLVYFIMGVL